MEFVDVGGCWFGVAVGTGGGGYYGQFEECANNDSGGTSALIYFLGSNFSKESQEGKMVIHSLGKGWMAKLQTWVAGCKKCHTLT